LSAPFSGCEAPRKACTENLFREAFSGGGTSRKAFREKTPRGLGGGGAPSRRKSVHGHPFQGLRPRKACMEKGANKLPNWDCAFGICRRRSPGGWKGAMPHPGKATGVREGVEPHPGISLGRDLGAIAQTVRGAFSPPRAVAQR